jgi:hypothetical protein
MKILDVPQTGKLGLTVTFPSRTGLIRRMKVTPSDPNTASQQTIRGNFTAAAHRYDTLTEAQQNAWSTAAGQYKSKPSLGQSGPLTGFQLFVKQNAILALTGSEPIDAPLPVPDFPDLAPQSLVLTRQAGVLKIALTCPTAPGENTLLRVGAPQRSGVRRCPNLKVAGTVPAPVQGTADITALYVGQFGVPAAGKRLFVECEIAQDDWYGPKRTFTALVPAAA